MCLFTLDINGTALQNIAPALDLQPTPNRRGYHPIVTVATVIVAADNAIVAAANGGVTAVNAVLVLLLLSLLWSWW